MVLVRFVGTGIVLYPLGVWGTIYRAGGARALACVNVI